MHVPGKLRRAQQRLCSKGVLIPTGARLRRPLRHAPAGCQLGDRRMRRRAHRFRHQKRAGKYGPPCTGQRCDILWTGAEKVDTGAPTSTPLSIRQRVKTSLQQDLVVLSEGTAYSSRLHRSGHRTHFVEDSIAVRAKCGGINRHRQNECSPSQTCHRSHQTVDWQRAVTRVSYQWSRHAQT